MQDEIAMNGWAFEARLYAENPAAGYLPSTGRLDHLRLPDTIRVDSGVDQGDDITAFYDPMIAKIVTHGPNREAALSKLAAACAGIEIWPVKSNAGLLARIAVDPDFRAARIDTGFLDRHDDRLVATEPSESAIDSAATALLKNTDSDPWTALTGFRISGADDKRVRIRIGDHLHWGQSRPELEANTVAIGETTVLFDAGSAWPISLPVASEVEASQGAGDGAILSPMPGINLSEAGGYYFRSGSAELTSEFQQKLGTSISDQIADNLSRYQVDVIEVIGHTDEQPLARTSSNLDKTFIDVLDSKLPITALEPADNAGLGLARAMAVANILKANPKLSQATVLPMSAAQLILPGDTVTAGQAGNVEARRRIEIRIRRRAQSLSP